MATKSPMERAIETMMAVNSGNVTLDEAVNLFGYSSKKQAGLAVIAAQKYSDAIKKREMKTETA